MKITVLDAVNATVALNHFIGFPGVSAKGIYWSTRLLKGLSRDVESFEKARLVLVEKHGEDHTEDGKPGKKVSESNMPAFQKEIADLLAAEVNVDLMLMRLECFDGIVPSEDRDTFNKSDMMVLQQFIEA
jgi:hypothetical protein